MTRGSTALLGWPSSSAESEPSSLTLISEVLLTSLSTPISASLSCVGDVTFVGSRSRSPKLAPKPNPPVLAGFGRSSFAAPSPLKDDSILNISLDARPGKGFICSREVGASAFRANEDAPIVLGKGLLPGILLNGLSPCAFAAPNADVLFVPANDAKPDVFEAEAPNGPGAGALSKPPVLPVPPF